MRPFATAVVLIAILPLLTGFLGTRLMAVMATSQSDLPDVYEVFVVLSLVSGAGWLISIAALIRGGFGSRVLLDRASGDVVEEWTKGVFFWRWDPRLKGRLLRSVEAEFSSYTVGMRLSVITPNPKVRELGYEVRFVSGGFAQSVSEFFRCFGHWDSHPWKPSVIEFVSSHLYEFQEDHSKELGELYNPLDKTQQSRFRQLLEQSLAPVLSGTGIAVKEARFTV